MTLGVLLALSIVLVARRSNLVIRMQILSRAHFLRRILIAAQIPKRLIARWGHV